MARMMRFVRVLFPAIPAVICAIRIYFVSGSLKKRQKKEHPWQDALYSLKSPELKILFVLLSRIQRKRDDKYHHMTFVRRAG